MDRESARIVGLREAARRDGKFDEWPSQAAALRAAAR